MPWCPTKVDSTTGAMIDFAICEDEEFVAYSGGAEGQYCELPFLMDER